MNESFWKGPHREAPSERGTIRERHPQREAPSERHPQRGIFLILCSHPEVFFRTRSGQAWSCTPVVAAMERLRQRNLKFKSSLGSIGRAYLKQKHCVTDMVWEGASEVEVGKRLLGGQILVPISAGHLNTNQSDLGRGTLN